ncbi:hypothetical protein I302_101540 [Kwoniella bestiolae CBS 10118]|uniref:Uncharacterized protein n=1 Tax=Kwoniella bestiolae CBS 10118 TaxID=1296100 RepID=A0A1B9GCI5_9TREE|nr:hypothetical protein I302_00225 [Kwoniella bestiolae CBS 10118]OCF28736.1 hypothetical protein I302_00225 [Kwoniella bestiolae CBS 10118]
MDSSNSPTSSSSSSAASAPLAPLRNPKYRHISKSAAKRESVQMLGSIKDLQLHFSRAGMVEHRPGAGVGVKGSNPLPSLGEDAEGEENRPPSALADRGGDRRPSERKPYKEVELPRIDPKDARRDARNIVSDVRGIWGLSLPISPNSATTSGLPSSKSLYFPINFDDEDGPQCEMRSSEDIQNALVQTAQSIRRIRFLALSISHHHSATRKVSGGGGAGSLFPIRLGGAGKLRSSLSTPSRPGSSKPLRTISNPNTSTDRKASLGALDEREDVLGELRKAALEVLTSLRELEERLRVTRADRAVQEDRSETPTQERPFSPYSDQGENVFSEPEPDNYDSEEDELYNPNNLAMNSENKDLMTNWEDRILSERREYKDLGDSDWEKEARGARENMGKWVGIVERLFVFVDEAQGERQMESWARDEEWDGKRLEQLHAFLLSNLPLDLALRLPSTNSDNFESSLLSRLSDGYILIHAYNSSLMRSSKPWGFIPDEDVHDTLTSLSTSGQVSPSKNGISDEGRKEKEWTFRKVGNLTCFGAALRHRYQLPVSMPTTNLPVPPIPAKSSRRPRPSIVTSSSATAAEDKIEFDPMIIAKKGQGWDGMFKGLIERWLGELVKEVRESKGHLIVDERVDRGGMI